MLQDALPFDAVRLSRLPVCLNACVALIAAAVPCCRWFLNGRLGPSQCHSEALLRLSLWKMLQACMLCYPYYILVVCILHLHHFMAIDLVLCLQAKASPTAAISLLVTGTWDS